MTNREKAYLLMGTNLGNKKKNMEEAKKLISHHCGTITRYSSIFETAAWGITDQPLFLNQALEIRTGLSAEQLLRELLKIEKIMGRERKEKYGPRVIDIDILLFSNYLIDSPFLKIPHPELQNRRFALTPLAEIAPEIIHPVLNKSISQLLTECSDALPVRIYEAGISQKKFQDRGN